MKTVMLAAGNVDLYPSVIDYAYTPLMSIINGKPAIAWVLNNFLKNTSQTITIVLQKSNQELFQFLNNVYTKNKRIELCFIEQPRTILDSCLTAIQSIKEKGSLSSSSALRIMLADTLLLNTEFISGDYIYVSSFEDLSEKWCIVDVDSNKRAVAFHNKHSSLGKKEHKAAIGRYEFSNSALFESALLESIALHKQELSDVIEVYAYKNNMLFSTIDVSSANWIDFGHLEGISKAKKQLIESRTFNSIEISTPVPLLTKRSKHKEKLKKEYLWYKSLPIHLKTLAPNIIEFSSYDEYAEIKMEYYSYPTLTEKFIYSSLSLSYWLSVIDNLFTLISEFKKITCPLPKDIFQTQAVTMYSEKTFQRIKELEKQDILWEKLLAKDLLTINGKKYKNIQLLTEFIQKKALILSKSIDLSFIHGDLCFNNILYDTSSDIIKLIDPRGEFGTIDTHFGDIRYDIAKIKHSFCGGYDHIVEGLFELFYSERGDISFSIPNINEVENERLFNSILQKNAIDSNIINFIEALLFISMTPLHNDSIKKQITLYAQGIIKLNNCTETWGEV